MSNYDQHIRHWGNHNKDKSYQQCGFHIEDKVESGASIAERIKKKQIYVAVKQTFEKLSPVYDNEDDTVDFYCALPKDKQMQCAIYNHGLLIMQ